MSTDTTPQITATLIEFETGDVVKTFDLTGYTPRMVEKFWNGLVYKVDFARFYIAEDLADVMAAADSGSGAVG